MTRLFKRDPGEWYRRLTGSRLGWRKAFESGNHNQSAGGSAMKPNSKISAAVAAILSAPATAIVLAAADTATATDTGTELQEVIVTANRREENMQNVPITIQALTGDALAKLNVTTLDDYVKLLPNVTSQGVGPGQNNIYMRGLSTGVTGIQGAGVVGSFPNVAIYLDDQSGQVPGRNLDIYAADLERIEVLEGPQGTLFGAGAQAGVVRYITNKPKLNTLEANFNAGVATTAHGNSSNKIEGVVNLPVVPDKLAVRLVAYNDRRGGYINNIPGTFQRLPTDLAAYTYHALPQNMVVINNSSQVHDGINPVTYKGARIAALWQFNDDWNALITQSFQQMEADGVFSEAMLNSAGQPQPDLSVQLYNPTFAKDRFHNTSWTLNGRIGALKAVYTGGYLVRNVEAVQDYTNYARGPYASYYQCVYGNAAGTIPAHCYTPSATWHDSERNTHISHELRFSTPDDWRLRGLGGLFLENYNVGEQVDWLYGSATQYLKLIAPPLGFCEKNGSIIQGPGDPKPGRPFSCKAPGVTFVPQPVTANNPNTRPATDAFFDDIKRGYTQRAAFASMDFDLVPRTLTLTAGTRYYRIESTERGSAIGSFGCKTFGAPVTPGATCTTLLNGVRASPISNGGNLDSLHLDKVYTGLKSRANLSWHVAEDALLYYTWSQGFRAGGFNRPNSVEGASPLSVNTPGSTAAAHGGWYPPTGFTPDSLVNNEIGWKTEWFNRRLQVNGAIYKEDWKNAQIAIFDPGVTGNLTFSTNGGNYQVKGLELSMLARATRRITVSAAASWNHSELKQVGSFSWNDGTPINFSQLKDSKGRTLSTPGGAVGSPLSSSPPFQASLQVRDDFHVGGFDAFWQLVGTHQAHSLATTDKLTLDLQGVPVNYDMPGFSALDAAVGFARDAWRVELYDQNVTDKRGVLYENARQWYRAVTTTRPRTIGLRFSYKFSGK
jgi:iron complex outermembrane receptor protein